MKKCSRIAALIVSFAMLFALCGTTACAVSYADVPTSAYFHDVIQKAAEVFIKGNGKLGIDGIHPFDCKLHRTAAVDNGSRRIDM